MTGAHVSGATIGALIGYLASHFGWNVSQDEAVAWGALVATIGGVIGHVATGPGILPAVKQAIFGPKR